MGRLVLSLESVDESSSHPAWVMEGSARTSHETREDN